MAKPATKKPERESKQKYINPAPSSLELTNLDLKMEKFKLALGIMNEMIYVEIIREDDNISHGKFEIKLKDNRFIENIAHVKPEFVAMVEKYFKGYQVQVNNSRTIYNIWLFKK